ncbi:hypothetical protein HAZT_HAZT011774, partial [Hyalella azteca]
MIPRKYRRISQPVLLGQLLRHLGGVQGYEEVWKGWAFGTGIILCSLLYLFTYYYHSYSVRIIGMKMRIASCGLIYRKVFTATEPVSPCQLNCGKNSEPPFQRRAKIRYNSCIFRLSMDCSIA